MSRKIEVELTSDRGDGTWTWRAAGAKQPKGELDGALLYQGVAVGDVVRAEADFEVDGIVVTSVLPPKARQRTEPERIEILGPPRRDDQLVTTTLAPRSGRGRGDRDRGERGDRDRRGDRGPRPARRGGERRDDDRRRGPRPEGREGPAERRERRPRPERPAPEPKPKAKRLRAGRQHRDEVLATVPEEHQAIAEQVLRGGIPAVRQAVDKQNEANREAGQPEINAAPIVAIAEQLLPRLRAAEWHDRADAALASAEDVDLRDLRSVVVAADDSAKDETTRELAAALRQALNQRVEREHAAWLTEIAEVLADGRVVRALRLSSRPPKAGAPFPADLSARLAEAAGQALTAETGQDRFATVLDALAYSPVRSVVVAQGLPAEPGEELLGAVRKLGSRLPQIAAQFGVEATAAPRRKGPRPGRKPAPAAKPADATPAAPEAPAEPEAPAADATPAAEPEAPGPQAPEAEGPGTATEAPAVEIAPEPAPEPVAPAQVADAPAPEAPEAAPAGDEAPANGSAGATDAPAPAEA